MKTPECKTRMKQRAKQNSIQDSNLSESASSNVRNTELVGNPITSDTLKVANRLISQIRTKNAENVKMLKSIKTAMDDLVKNAEAAQVACCRRDTVVSQTNCSSGLSLDSGCGKYEPIISNVNNRTKDGLSPDELLAANTGKENKMDGEPEVSKVTVEKCQIVYYTHRTPEQILSRILKEVRMKKIKSKPFYMPYRFWCYKDDKSKMNVIKIHPLLILPPKGIKRNYEINNAKDLEAIQEHLKPNLLDHGQKLIAKLNKADTEVQMLKRAAKDQFQKIFEMAALTSDLPIV